MSYVRWDPWKRIGLLQNRINQLISDPASDPIVEDEIAGCEWKPAVDILETVAGVIIKADLPGVKKENVSVELKDNLVTLKGERTTDIPAESEKCYRRERCFGSFFRAFMLPGTHLRRSCPGGTERRCSGNPFSKVRQRKTPAGASKLNGFRIVCAPPS